MHKIIVDMCIKDVERRIESLDKGNRVLHIFSLTDDSSAALYMNRKVDEGKRFGVPVMIHTPNSVEELHTTMKDLAKNKDNRIIIQKPFDESKWGGLKELHSHIPYYMDVDGFGFTMLDIVETKGYYDMLNNPRFSPTAKGVMMIMDRLVAGQFKGKKVTVLGKGLTSGLPIGLMSAQLGCTVRWTNSGTSNKEMNRLVSDSDFVVGCTGKPNLINTDCCIKSPTLGHYINVGMTKVEGKWYGDIDFKEIQNLNNTVFCNNLFGSTGKLTTLCLILNTLI